MSSSQELPPHYFSIQRSAPTMPLSGRLNIQDLPEEVLCKTIKLLAFWELSECHYSVVPCFALGQTSRFMRRIVSSTLYSKLELDDVQDWPAERVRKYIRLAAYCARNVTISACVHHFEENGCSQCSLQQAADAIRCSKIRGYALQVTALRLASADPSSICPYDPEPTASCAGVPALLSVVRESLTERTMQDAVP